MRAHSGIWRGNVPQGRVLFRYLRAATLLHRHSLITPAAPRTPAAPDRSSRSRRRRWRPAMARSRFIYEYIRFGGLGDAQLIDAASKHIHAHSIGTIQSARSRAPPTGSPTTSWWRCACPGSFAPTSAKATTRTVPPATRSTIAAILRARRRHIARSVPLHQQQATRTEAAFLFGVKAPTGATNRLDAQGLLFETEFQPGSGRGTCLLGGAFTQRFGAWSFDAQRARHHRRSRRAGHQARQPLALQRRGLLPPHRLSRRLNSTRTPRAALVRVGARAGAAPPSASTRENPRGANRNGPSTRCSS